MAGDTTGGVSTVRLNKPHGIFADALGNLYIADTENHRILKTDVDSANTNGKSVIVAGHGWWFSGDSGDTILATNAKLNMPRNIFVDGKDDLYIADTNNHRVLKVDQVSGIISTIAGFGFRRQDGSDRLGPGFSGDGGPATLANLAYPWDIFVDKSGDVYIADKENNRIRKIDGNTGIITTDAGDGKSKPVAITHSGPHRGQFYGDGGPATKAGITSPMSVYVDDNNNIYIADTLNHRIRKIDSTGVITTLAGDGRLGIITSTYRDVGNWATQIWGYTGAFFGEGKLATQASLSFPSDVWVDARGDVYVADRDNHRIRRIDSKTGIITTIVGDGWRHSEYEGLPEKYVGHGEKEGTYSSRIRDGRLNGDGQLAHKASLNQPFGIHIDLQGNLYIADTQQRLYKKS